MNAGAVNFGTEAATMHGVFKNVPVVTGRLALPQSEDVSEANQHRHERHQEGYAERQTDNDEQHKEQRDARADAADQPPEKPAFQSPGASFRVGCGIGVGQSKFVFHVPINNWAQNLETADTNCAVCVQSEDFVKGEHRRRCCRDDGAADDGHFALVHIAATDGEPAVDDGGDPKDKAEHHDYGQTVADAGLEVGGVERRALREGRQDVEREQGRDGEQGAQTCAGFFKCE